MIEVRVVVISTARRCVVAKVLAKVVQLLACHPDVRMFCKGGVDAAATAARVADKEECGFRHWVDY